MNEPQTTIPLMIFFRSEGFYSVEAVDGVPLCQQATDHAALNPGTLKIEDIEGNILWSL